jgi:CubicO group peptidase (beta-lactamase class C family)
LIGLNGTEDVEGFVAPGFEPVAEVFLKNFSERGEIGAAFAAFLGDEPLVDVWGGLADRQAGLPWLEDTLQVVFSGTKGFTSICALMLIESGQLSLDERVRHYWAEFGKPEIRVRDIFGHTARLPGFQTNLSLDSLKNNERMVQLLAEQLPSDDPRAVLCYHPITFGWLAGELIRRIDGRNVHQFFEDEVARPLNADIWIGLPEAFEPRVGALELDRDWGTTAHLDPSSIEGDALLHSVWGNPQILTRESFPWNRADFHAAEIPAINGIGTARSIARLYACLSSGGNPLLSKETVDLGRTVLSEGFDRLHNTYRRFGVGFQLQSDDLPYGPPLDAFGHGGAGGSLHGAWPTQGVGFSYVMNLMRDDGHPDPPGRAVLVALHECLSNNTAINADFTTGPQLNVESKMGGRK